MTLNITPRARRRLKWLAMCLAVLYVGFLVAVGRAMRQPPEEFGRFMKHMPMPAYFIFPFETMWTQARAGHLKIGDSAPDFNLEAQDKSGSVQLSSFLGKKPVVLVFGSYT